MTLLLFCYNKTAPQLLLTKLLTLGPTSITFTSNQKLFAHHYTQNQLLLPHSDSVLHDGFCLVLGVEAHLLYGIWCFMHFKNLDDIFLAFHWFWMSPLFYFCCFYRSAILVFWFVFIHKSLFINVFIWNLCLFSYHFLKLWFSPLLKNHFNS